MKPNSHNLCPFYMECTRVQCPRLHMTARPRGLATQHVRRLEGHMASKALLTQREGVSAWDKHSQGSLNTGSARNTDIPMLF